MSYKVLISKNKVEELIKKLPVSYYLGAKLEVDVSNSATSYIDLLERKIYISPNNFMQIELQNEPSEYDIENLVRCALYHETSHAMLSPVTLLENKGGNYDKDLINIFEDERIETLLKDYYHRSNFKRFVKLVNNYKENTMPKTAKEFFYQVVRFREINEDILNSFVKRLKDGMVDYETVWRLKEYVHRYPQNQQDLADADLIKDAIENQIIRIINTYNDKEISAFYGSESDIKKYKKAIYNLYFFLSIMFKINQQDQQREAKKSQEGEENKGAGGKETQQENKPISVNSSQKNKQSGNQESTQSQNQSDNEKAEQEETKVIIINEESFKKDENEIKDENENEETKGNINDYNGSVLEQVKEFINRELNSKNTKFYDACNKIIKSYRSANKLNGNMGSAYSGRLDARLYVRDNNETFRWFLHKNGNSVKRGSKLKLNIFCDTSGSFERNEDKVNSMLKELERIERENSNLFDFDIVEVDYDMRILPKKARRIKVISGGTNLTKEWKKTIDKLQDTSKDVINIVLFDGKIYSSYDKHLMALFNKNNMVIISDDSNAPAIKRYCKQARKQVFVDAWRESYTDLLEDNVLKALNSYIMGL